MIGRWLIGVRLMRLGASCFTFPRPRLRDYLRPHTTVFYAIGHALRLTQSWEAALAVLAHRHRRPYRRAPQPPGGPYR